MHFRSIRFKISVLYTGILAVILVSYSLLLYFNLNYVVYRDIDIGLKKKAREIEETIGLYSQTFADESAWLPMSRTLHLEQHEKNEFFQWPSIKKIDQMWSYTIHALGIKRDYIVLYDFDGVVEERSANIDAELLRLLQEDFRAGYKLRTSIRDITVGDRELRVLVRPIYRLGKLNYFIQLATPTESHHLLLRSKLKLIMVTIPFFLLSTSFLGAFFFNRSFKPIRQITQAAQQISHRDMSQRVRLQHTDQEIRALVEAFNDMISRLERSFHHIETFSSTVAHELKTPIAIIQGEMEVALRKERTLEEYQQSLRTSLEETQRVLNTINDLLLLAKLDYQTEGFKFEPVELNEFINDIAEQGKLMAGPKDIAVRFFRAKQPLTISASKLHLRRLFFNLIDNAIKFTPPSGRIDIAITSEEAQAKVMVRDSGIGINDEDLPQIFNRFFSAGSSDHADVSIGLGLSIVQSIAKLHNATVKVTRPSGQGTMFTVILPLA